MFSRGIHEFLVFYPYGTEWSEICLRGTFNFYFFRPTKFQHNSINLKVRKAVLKIRTVCTLYNADLWNQCEKEERIQTDEIKRKELHAYKNTVQNTNRIQQ